MVVVRYLQACKNWFIDCRTLKFVGEDSRVKAFDIDVPFYLWDYEEPEQHEVCYGVCFKDGKMMNTYSVRKKVQSIELNKLSVQFAQGYASSVIQFLDTATNQWHTIEVMVTADVSTYTFGKRGKLLTGWSFLTHIDTGGAKSDHISLAGEIRHDMWSCEEREVRFNRIVGLGCQDIPEYTNHKLSYGVRSKEYLLYYKKQKLSFTSVALVAGAWAILLTDDLQFQSLAYLRGTSQNTLFIDRFAYSLDRRAIKAMTLVK